MLAGLLLDALFTVRMWEEQTSLEMNTSLQCLPVLTPFKRMISSKSSLKVTFTKLVLTELWVLWKWPYETLSLSFSEPALVNYRIVREWMTVCKRFLSVITALMHTIRAKMVPSNTKTYCMIHDGCQKKSMCENMPAALKQYWTNR